MESKTSVYDKSSLICKESRSSLTSKLSTEQDEKDQTKSSQNSTDNDNISEALLEIMKLERNRLSSFGEKWPLQFIKVIDLAKAGFFYLQLDERVQCAYCKLVLDSWKNGDTPLKLHIKESPKCPFLISSTRKLPAVHNSQVPSSYCNKFAPLPPDSNSHRPKKPHMCDIKRRISTFEGWPLTTITAEELADCGFYYTGEADVVTCFFCGGSLGGWEPFDDPVTEHNKYYPKCGYLRLLCNRPIQQKTILKKPLNMFRQNSEQSVKQAVASEILKSDIIQEASKIFPLQLVHDVVLQYLKHTGKTFTSLSQLSETILEREENRLRNRTNAEVKDEQSSNFLSYPGTHEAKNLTTYVKDALLCKICMNSEMGIVFQPCGHLVTCGKCAELISECPLCRRPIESRIRTYLS